MPSYELARGTLDPGLFSDNAEKMREFYDRDVGLSFFESLRHTDTYAELYFKAPGGKLKIQAFAEPIAPAVTGYREILIAREGVRGVETRVDPDGLTVRIVPPGHRGVTHLGFVCAVPDVEAQRNFLVRGLQARESAGGLRVGDTQLFLERAPAAGRPTPPMRRGFTYITLIVHDCAAAHQALLDAGAEHSLRVLRLADRCLFSWVRDPSGNWIEVVQYAELSGPLPDVERLDRHWDEVIRWREQAIPF